MAPSDHHALPIDPPRADGIHRSAADPNVFDLEPGKNEALLIKALRAAHDEALAVSKASGAGMTREAVKLALPRFGHGEDEHARKHQGLGLGLPLVRALAALLGGTMRIASSPGEGTAVTLSFPPENIQERAFEWKPLSNRMAERADPLANEDRLHSRYYSSR